MLNATLRAALYRNAFLRQYRHTTHVMGRNNTIVDFLLKQNIKRGIIYKDFSAYSHTTYCACAPHVRHKHRYMILLKYFWVTLQAVLNIKERREDSSEVLNSVASMKFKKTLLMTGHSKTYKLDNAVNRTVAFLRDH
jgi:hypothetical protein